MSATPSVVFDGVVALRKALSVSAQNYHATFFTYGVVRGRTRAKTATPHKFSSWYQCPAMACKEARKVMQLTDAIVPVVNNPYALAKWWKKQKEVES